MESQEGKPIEQKGNTEQSELIPDSIKTSPTKDENLNSEDAISTEYEFNPDGKKVLTRFIFSKASKFEIADFILRIVGAFAVIVALFDLGCNIRAQKKQIESQVNQQKLLYQLSIYEKTLPVLNLLSTKSPKDSIYASVKNEFSFEILPKLLLTFDTSKNEDSVLHFTRQFDSITVLREHCYGLYDSFPEYRSKIFLLMNEFSKKRENRDYKVSDSVKKEVYKPYINYQEFYFSKRNDWENHKSEYVKLIKSNFGDTSVFYSQLDTFYSHIADYNKDYMNIYTYIHDNRRPNDQTFLDFESGLNQRDRLSTNAFDSAFERDLANVHSFYSVIYTRMKKIQTQIWQAMSISNQKLRNTD